MFTGFAARHVDEVHVFHRLVVLVVDREQLQPRLLRARQRERRVRHDWQPTDETARIKRN